ncbi:MAG: cytochrome c, partial [Gammaproteobacteria bacterium]
MMRMTTILAGLVLASAMSTTAMAESDPAERALEYRQGAFNAMAWSFGPMAAMVKNKMPYDA